MQASSRCWLIVAAVTAASAQRAQPTPGKIRARPSKCSATCAMCDAARHPAAKNPHGVTTNGSRYSRQGPRAILILLLVHVRSRILLGPMTGGSTGWEDYFTVL